MMHGQTKIKFVCVESDELFPGWCVVDPSSVWGSSVGECQQLTKLRTFDSLSLFGSSSGPSHFSLNLLKPSQDSLPMYSFKHLVSFGSSSHLPDFETKYCIRSPFHGNRNALDARGRCWWSDWTRILFLSSLTVLTGGDRNWSQLVYVPKPHLCDNIRAVTLYCFISQGVKLSLRAGERLDVYCSPVGNDTVSGG